MATFDLIETSDPSSYKQKIIKLWDETLKNTPHERISWLQFGNPAGETHWILAIDKRNNKLSGTISLMPKEMRHSDKIVKGLILGDYMVQTKYRVYGPAILLAKAAIKSAIEKKMDFIYSVPNKSSGRIVQGAGLKNTLNMVNFAKPVFSFHYAKKYLKFTVAKILSPYIDIFLRVFSLETYAHSKKMNVTMDSCHDIDKMLDKINGYQIEECTLTAERCQKYLKWRYFDNPTKKYFLLTCKDKKDRRLLGYLIYSKTKYGIDIDDVLLVRFQIFKHLLKKLVKIARTQKCRSIYFTVPEKSMWAKELKYYGFMNSHGGFQISWLTTTKIPFEQSMLYSGDRNI